MIYNFTITLTGIHFTTCEVRIRILNYYCSYYFINLAFCTGRSHQFFTHKASQNKLPKVDGFIADIIYFQKSAFLYFYILSDQFSFWSNFPPLFHCPLFPQKISLPPTLFFTNLNYNLRHSLICYLSLALLFLQ